ncbi:MAG: tetratricopeptide repeat protein [Nitrospira sp.]|nr:tetratricopeptide repeat protein [Nitrospira sp.]
MFALAVGVILATVVVFLAYPFWRKGGSPMPLNIGDSPDQNRVDLEMEKQRILASISELDHDYAQGRLALADYQRLRTTDEHRLVKILDGLDQWVKAELSPTPQLKVSPPRRPPMPWVGPVILGLLVVGSASGIYSYMNGKIGLEAQKAARENQAQSGSSQQGMPNPIEMVARLEARLRQNPNDLQGQIMAGRSYMSLQQFEDAKKAWNKVVELDPRNDEAHYSLGLILLQEGGKADPKVYEEALAHFDTALINVPREPAVLWYRGVALVHLKRYREADDSWTTAYQNLTPGSEDAEFVKQSLQNLRAGNPPVF